eukprot:3690773-Rhodomonas_salina.1
MQLMMCRETRPREQRFGEDFNNNNNNSNFGDPFPHCLSSAEVLGGATSGTNRELTFRVGAGCES